MPGLFAKASLIVPGGDAADGARIWLSTPEHKGKELDAIAI
jgi:hypothetical protein